MEKWQIWATKKSKESQERKKEKTAFYRVNQNRRRRANGKKVKNYDARYARFILQRWKYKKKYDRRKKSLAQWTNERLLPAIFHRVLKYSNGPNLHVRYNEQKGFPTMGPKKYIMIRTSISKCVRNLFLFCGRLLWWFSEKLVPCKIRKSPPVQLSIYNF